MTDMEVVRRLDRIINILSNRLPEREVEGTRPEPGDVDPDEALAEALRVAFEGRDEMSWAEVARTAREHIEAEGEHAAMTIVRETEADLALVTWERDGWKREAERWQGKAIEERTTAQRYSDRALKAEAELARVTKERDAYKRAKAENDDRFQIEAHDWRERADKAQAKADRYDALRADLKEYTYRHGVTGAERAMGRWLLARDTGRAES